MRVIETSQIKGEKYVLSKEGKKRHYDRIRVRLRK
jgi:hypothetical protein